MLTSTPRAIAESLISTVSSVQATLSDGFQVNDFLALFTYLSSGAPAFVELANATTEEKAQIAGELFDALTGNDDTALFLKILPGLDGNESEEVLDFVKKIVISKVN